jgi:hypothetical protein
MKGKIKFVLLVFVFLSSAGLSHCPLCPDNDINGPGCVDFEDQTVGNKFYVGQLINSSGVSFMMEEFIYSNMNSTSDGFLRIQDNGHARGSGKDINTVNVNIRPIFQDPLTRISAKYGELGGNVNMMINGESSNVNNLHNLHNTVLGGAQINVEYTQDGANYYGQFSITGNISEFSVGGQELWLDDFCFAPPIGPSTCEEEHADVTTGTPGVPHNGQSFNETRTVEVTVLGQSNRIVESLELRGLIISSPTATVGARIYDSATQALIASANVTQTTGTDITVNIPVSAVLTAGKKYRIGFYVETQPIWLAKGDFFKPDGFSGPNAPVSYIESSGAFRINAGCQTSGDTFPPTNSSTVAIKMIIHTRCP